MSRREVPPPAAPPAGYVVADAMLCEIQILDDAQRADQPGTPECSGRFAGLGWVVAMPLRAFDGTARAARRSDRRRRASPTPVERRQGDGRRASD